MTPPATRRGRRPRDGVMIELRGVTFGYEKAQSSLDVPSLAIGAGVTLVLGANGSGKSTLLRLIAGVEPPRTGVVSHRRE